MEKKIYNKPEIIKTDVDCVITLVCDSANSTDCNPEEIAPLPDGAINPFKWFK